MLKMKLPQRKSKLKASDDEEDEEERGPCSMCEPGALQREAAYKWFVNSLGPAHRLEFACGLLDLCNPLELRFLGSYLEDLARKDCHYLRDFETRANGLSEEAAAGLQQLLGNLSDSASRSKLIIYLALLSPENREVASRMYRLLLLPTVGPGGLLGGWDEEEDEREPREVEAASEELLLLFTMASLHPAFSFHQRVNMQEKLEELRKAMCRIRRTQGNVHEYLPSGENHMVESCSAAHNGVSATSHKLQREAVHIEKISFIGVQTKRAEKNLEYTFKVTWSDHSVTSVTKSHKELLEFLLKLPKEFSSESFDKTILCALNQGFQTREDRSPPDLEPIVRQIFSSQAFLQNQRVQTFFQAKPGESSHPHSNLPAGPNVCKTPELFKEDSSEASSQEEDVQQHMTIHKKHGGKCLLANSVTKSSSLEGLHMLHPDQNGGTDWQKKSCPGSPHPDSHTRLADQRAKDKWSPRASNRDTATSERKISEKFDGRAISRTNGVKHIQSLDTAIIKEPTLEVGSGHETCGETSSESYSSPSSPRHDRRESFESEEERDRDTDSNSEDSAKHSVSSFTAKLPTSHSNSTETPVDDTLNTSKFHITFMPNLPCGMYSGAEKTETMLSPPLPAEGKAIGLLVTSPLSLSPVRETYNQGSFGISVPAVSSNIGESEKRIDVLNSSLPVPSTFLSRNCSLSNPALTLPIHRLKVSSQGPSEACTLNGSTQTSLGLGSATTGFISVHSPGGFAVPPVTASDPLLKPQVVGLNQVVPHPDGNAGALPPSTNLKLVLPANSMSPAPPSVSYPLSGATLATGVLPTQNTNVLNAAVTAVSSQPGNVAMGQVQATIPPAVPTHTPGPAPSPSPALTHSTAQSDSTSFISAAVGNTSTNGSLLPPQQMGPGACGSCGRRCGCGNNGVPVGSYFYANPIHGQVYRVPPFFTLPSICNGTYLNQAHQSNGTQLPFFLSQAPYTNGLMHDPVLGGQANYGIQQVPGYGQRYFQMYTGPVHSTVPNANGSGPKKTGNISCYNCGVAGHYAQDCKQPTLEASQQGTYRLRYAPPPSPSHDTMDSTD
ncbi:zinc finger CCHC domain-containing protein 2 isoform X2 [Bombina bombina]|uniref:zinc finger CCHC domain-containing protein 2 isoform X2 n=1 Tax=Bombina bombina TaxID=8345 RepID=UPI00235AF654|nr:zinc finger CCHC domain-containing protein 2 isoform X2 [Bombina bombina]